MIGVVLLSIGCLVSEDLFYDWEEGRIREMEFNGLIRELKTRYSPLFCELVRKCLEFDPRKRPDLKRIVGYLVERKKEV